MTRPMAKWIIFATLLSIGLTALLTAVLMRMNKPSGRDAVEGGGSDGGGDAPLYIAPERRHSDANDNGSHDGGGDSGGDGGGD